MDFEMLTSGWWYILYLGGVMVASGVARKYGLFMPVFRFIAKHVKSKRAVVGLISAVAGVLPIPGRVTVSAGVLDTIAPRDDRRQVYGIIDYFSTHHYYFWSPLEKTVIVPMAVLGISYGTFMGLIWPMLLGAIIMIIGYLMFYIKEDDVEIVLDQSPSEHQKIEWVNWGLLAAVAGIIVVGNIIKSYNAELTAWVESTNYLPAALLFSFIAAFAMGSSGKFAGLVALLTSVFGLKWLPAFFAVDYAGYMLSPTHKCSIIGRGYFKTNMKKFYKAVGAFVLVLGVIGFSSTALADDRVEVNAKVYVGDSFMVGVRENYRLQGGDHRILRWDFKDSPWRVEYRRVSSVGSVNSDQNWYRIQHKDFKYEDRIGGKFFYNSRIEYRDRENRENVWRYRPQFGYKGPRVGWNDVISFGKPFIIFEPHWEIATGVEGFKQNQLFIGTTFQVRDWLQVEPFLEIDHNENIEKKLSFYGVEIKAKF